MLTLTAKQVHTIGRLQDLARRSYERYDYPGSVDHENTVQIAALSDSAATDEGRGLIAECNGQLWRAVVVAVRYVSSDWVADDGPTRVPIIVRADGSTWGAPYELTGEITVTAPFDTALLGDDIPDPRGHDLECVLHDEIATRLTTIAAHVVEKAHRAKPVAD